MTTQFRMFAICLRLLSLGGTVFAASQPLKGDLVPPKTSAAPQRPDYSYKNLHGKNLSGKDLRGVWFYESQLDHVVLDNADASRVSFVGASLVKAQLRHAKLTGAYFNYCDLTKADFTGADLRGVDFLRARLVGARSTGAKLAAAELSAADLRQANLRGADLRLVQGPLHDARNAENASRLHFSVNLQGAIYDQSTRWPRHMRPEAFGAVRVQETDNAPIPMSYDTPLPYRALWGPYTVSVVKLGDNNSDRLQILDTRGNVLREIKAPRIQEVTYPHLSGRGPVDLRVLAFPESNIIHDRRTFVFTRAGGLRNVLVMPDEFDSVRNLGHDGRRELIADTVAPLEYVADVCHGCSPNLMLVLGWGGHRYKVQNRRYPWLARREAYHYREELLDNLHDSTLPAEAGTAPAIGYWANMETVGAGKSALRWLMRKMSRSARREFLAALPDVRVRLARLPHQIAVSQQRVFVLAD